MFNYYDDKQKEAAGRSATFFWIGAVLHQLFTGTGGSLWLGLALAFVGMFPAAIVFGNAIFWLDYGLSWVLAKTLKPTPGITAIVRIMSWALFVVEGMVIYFIAALVSGLLQAVF